MYKSCLICCWSHLQIQLDKHFGSHHHGPWQDGPPRHDPTRIAPQGTCALYGIDCRVVRWHHPDTSKVVWLNWFMGEIDPKKQQSLGTNGEMKENHITRRKVPSFVSMPMAQRHQLYSWLDPMWTMWMGRSDLVCVPLARLQDIFVTKDSVIFHYSTQIVVPFKMSLLYLSLQPCPMLACCGWLLYPIPMPSPHPWLLLGSGEPEFHCTGQGCRTFQGQFFSIIHILSEMWKDQKDLPRKG